MKNRGFTMMELLIGMAVVAIVASIGFPTFMAQRDRARIKRAGRELVSHFQTARINAMRDGRTWAVSFDTANQKYTLNHAGADGTLDTEDDVQVKEVALSGYGDVTFGIGDDAGPRPGSSSTPEDGVSFSNNRITFDPDGTSRSSGISGTVYMQNNKGQTFAVGSISASGRIKAWANYGQGWES